MANIVRNKHLDKLIMHVKFMEWALDNTEPSRESYTGWYKKEYPALRERTMKRDVQELEKIGINICHEYLEEFDTDNDEEFSEDNTMDDVIHEYSPNCYYVDLCEFQSIINFGCW